MFPTLIDLGTHDLPWLGETHLFLPSYGFLFALAVLLAWGWFMRRARTLEIADETLFNLTFYTLLAGIFGAKAVLILVDWQFYLNDPVKIIGTLRSAGVLMGGVIFGALMFTFYARRHRLPLFRLGDAIAAPLVMAQGVGRLGCLSAGCCWGMAASPGSRFALTFTNPQAHEQTGVPLNSPRVPTQLLEMLFDFALALLLTYLWRRPARQPGYVFWIYVLLYSIGRGVIEFWRGDALRGLWLSNTVSTSQLLALAGIALAVLMLIRGRLLARSTAAA